MNTNTIWFQKYGKKKYKYYWGWEIWPNTNMNTIRVQYFDRIRIRILFGVPLLFEYEHEYLDYLNIKNTYTNNNDINTKPLRSNRY